MNATLSILGLYNYDSTIFDNLHIPDKIDKEDVINNLLMELAEFEILYTDFNMMKFAIGAWSKKELPIWNKLYDTTTYEYNPIFNYDRTEEIVDDENRNLKINSSEKRDLHGSNNETRNLTISDNEIRNINYGEVELRDLEDNTTHSSDTSGSTTNNGTDSTKEYVSAFNQSDTTLSKQIDNTLGSGHSSTGKVAYTTKSTDTGTVDEEKTEKGTIDNTKKDMGNVDVSLSDTGTVLKEDLDTGNINKKRTHKISGNIGVTTTQQMIEAERKVVIFNVIDYIIDSFKTRFCLLIY